MKARARKQKLTPKHQEQFVAMLPTITRIARQAFSDLDLEGKEEAIATDGHGCGAKRTTGPTSL